MTCVHCGEELLDGCLFCSTCGKEVQIVPDYNEFDDEYLNQLVLQSVDKERKREQVLQRKRSAEQLRKQNQVHRQKILLRVALVSLLAVVLVGVAVSVQVKANRASSFDYQCKKGVKEQNRGNISNAISYYEVAASIQPENIEVKHRIAELYLQLGEESSAEYYYLQCVQIDDNDLEAFKMLLSIYERQGAIQKIIKLKTKSSDGPVNDLFQAYTVMPPEFDAKEGEYSRPLELKLSAPKGVILLYTMDGSDPTEAGLNYSEPLKLEEEQTYCVKAVCKNDMGMYSDVVSKEYKILIPPPDMPNVSPDGGTFVAETTVSVHVPAGCTAYYTWDGKNPNIDSMRYNGYVVIPEGNNVLSVVLYDYITGKYSEVYRGRFEYYKEEADSSGNQLEE